MARKLCNTNVLNIQKYVVAERFIRILKNKIYKYMTSISNGYIDKLDDIMNKCNDTYHRTIKIKPVDVKPSMYIDFNKENNNEGSKFKVSGNVRIPKHGNIFVEGYIPSWFEEIFVIKTVKNTLPWTYFISDFKSEEIVGTFNEKELLKQIKKSLD